VFVAQSTARQHGEPDAHPTTWELDPASGRWAAKNALSGQSSFGTDLATRLPIGHDALFYDPASHRTTFVESTFGTAPAVWQWDGSVWTRAIPTGVNYGIAFDAAAAFDPASSSVWVFGGRRVDSSGFRHDSTSDLWRLDLRALRWSLTPVSVTPQPRSGAAM